MDHHVIKALVKQKFRAEENIITTFNVYQIVGSDHQNRILAIVHCHDTNALFAFAVNNRPMIAITINDLTIAHLWEINNELRIEENITSGISSHKFKIYNNTNSQIYYYHPDDATLASKNIFQHFLQQIIVEYCFGVSNFKWLEPYKMPDHEATMSKPNLSDSSKIMAFKARYELERRKNEYTTFEGKKIYIATWNCNKFVPNDEDYLNEWLANAETAPDIYAIGLQEIDMSAQNIITKEQRPDRDWIVNLLKSLYPISKYKELKTLRMVGLMLTVIIKEELEKAVTSCTWDMVGTGPMGMGNKGGLGISLILNGASICFINSHLAAHMAEVERRNEDHNEIIRRMLFIDDNGRRSIDEHQQIFWMGDLNYRIMMDKKDIKEHPDYEFVYKYDQLFIEKTGKRIFMNYTEPPILFLPTYKYDVGTDVWDTSEKQRTPAFCDRILYKGQHIKAIKYDSVMTLRQSDHKPVYGVFDVELQKTDQEKFKRVKDDVLRLVTNCENNNSPTLTVKPTDVDFGKIRFNERVTREVHITNNSHSTGDFRIDGSEPWIEISQAQGSLIAGQSLIIKIDILIDKSSVSQVLQYIRYTSSGIKIPLHFLVLHGVNGCDVSITLFGEFKPSCFGLSLETLTMLTKPVSQYDLRDLMQIERSRDEENQFEISNRMLVPREIWLLIDHLYKNGLTTPYLFTASREYSQNSNINEIRDWLDTWSELPFPGTPHMAAEALLFLLEATPEPVIGISARECSVYCDNFERCREVILRQKSVNRRIFLYICSFLRELRKHYQSNRMDDFFLANLFGQIMLREPHSKAPKVDGQRTQTFMLNFLTNDITAFAKQELK